MVVPRLNDLKKGGALFSAAEAIFQKYQGVHHHRDEDSFEEDTAKEDSSKQAQLQPLPGDPKSKY